MNDPTLRSTATARKRDLAHESAASRPHLTRIDATLHGDRLVPTAMLRKRLGGFAFDTWTFLAGTRSDATSRRMPSTTTTGVYGTVRAMFRARAAGGRSHAAVDARVKRAVARLKAAGLVEVVGWERCPSGLAKAMPDRPPGWLMHRLRVRGLNLGARFVVNAKTEAWMGEQERTGNGGKRAGAGRPAGVKEARPRRRREPSVESEVHLPFHLPPQVGELRSVAPSALSPEVCKAHISVEERTYSDDADRIVARLRRAEEYPDLPKPAPFRPTVVPTVPLPLPGALDDALAVIRRRPDLTARGVPPRVSVAAMLPRRPPPPCLDPSATSAAHVGRIAAWLDAAITRKFGSPDWGVRKMTPRVKKACAAAAAQFVEHGLPPVFWIVWSIEQFCTSTAHAALRARMRGGRPSVDWILSPSRIDRSHEWCQSEMHSCFGDIPPHSAESSELIIRQGRLHADLFRAECTVCADLDAEEWAMMRAAIVHVHLPWTLYARLMGAIEADSERVAKELNNSTARGIWVWR